MGFCNSTRRCCAAVPLSYLQLFGLASSLVQGVLLRPGIDVQAFSRYTLSIRQSANAVSWDSHQVAAACRVESSITREATRTQYHVLERFVVHVLSSGSFFGIVPDLCSGLASQRAGCVRHKADTTVAPVAVGPTHFPQMVVADGVGQLFGGPRPPEAPARITGRPHLRSDRDGAWPTKRRPGCLGGPPAAHAGWGVGSPALHACHMARAHPSATRKSRW